MDLEQFKHDVKLSKIYLIAKKIYWKLIYSRFLSKQGIICTFPKEIGTTDVEYFKNSRIIVSLTSFPDRIIYVGKGICSLLNQELKPNKIVLYLSKNQFPEKEKQLPNDLTLLKKYGLEIKWEDGDIKSYKKLIPALRDFPNDIIVTADDDLYYPKNWLSSLVESYKENKSLIHCHLITFIKTTQEGNIIFIDSYGKNGNGSSSYSYKILSGAGTLFPPHSLDIEVSKVEAFMEIAPTNDDLWYWAMAINKQTKIKWIKNNMKRLYYIEYSQETTPCLYSNNNIGKNLRLSQLLNLNDKYNILNYLQ